MKQHYERLIIYMEKHSKIIDALSEVFTTGFTEIYNKFDKAKRDILLEYSNNFFRKWYYSSFIDNTELSPAFLADAANDKDTLFYPVIGYSDTGIDINTYEFSISDHPFLSDIRAIANSIEGIVKFDEGFNISEEFYNGIKHNISMADKRYVEYIFILGLEMGIFEKMPSVGITAVRRGKRYNDILNMPERDIFSLVIDKAVYIAADSLSESFLGEYYDIQSKDIENWLKDPVPIDAIFNDFFDEIGLGAEAMESLLSGGADEMDRMISMISFRLGLRFDKWFLTPFGYYLRLIDPCYLCSFSFYDELAFFMETLKSCEDIEEKDIMDAAVYSPCTSYRLTKLGADMLNAVYEKDHAKILDTVSPEEIVRIVAEGSKNEVEELISKAIPQYDLVTLRISDFSKEKLWLDIDISAESTLDHLHLYMLYIFGREALFCQSFMFYKLPKSPFTEYTPSYMEERGPKTDSTRIKELLGEGEECFYKAVFYSEGIDDVALEAKITCKKIFPCKKGYDHPRISKLCKRLNEDKNR